MPLQIIRQDITKMKVDAVVNTTNSSMIGYSGVDLAIHTLAGEEFDEECGRLVPLALGEAKITGGYRLPAKHVIHTSGPSWRGGNHGESEILRSCYLNSLRVAVENKCRTVAFPLISAGVYQFPKDQVLKFAVQTITEFLFEHELTVYICVYDKESYSFSQKLFNDIKSFIDDDYVEEREEDFLLESRAPSRRRVKANLPNVYRDASCKTPRPTPMPKRLDSCASMPDDLGGFLGEMDKSFSEMLFELIDKKEIDDVSCYKKANVDKRTFSKIKSNKGYKPSKTTAIAFAIALELDIDETQRLLATVGFTLSESMVFDKIIRYFIYHQNYNIFEINEALFEFDQSLLGV